MPANLDVMTFNIRYDHVDPPNLWPDRRTAVRHIVESCRPDLVGIQEGEYHQLLHMQRDLDGYDWLGLGREGGSHGEFMAIFYRHKRFEPVEYDHFWLSDTPDRIGSRSWGNEVPRMVTWARFRDRSADAEIYVLNTHFDHEVEESRRRSADLVLERIGHFDPDLPLLVIGDFNAPAGEGYVYSKLVESGPLTDAWVALGRQEPPLGTYHAFDGLETESERGRIDWILSRGPIEACEIDVITTSLNGQYPSDHFPVMARMRLG